MKKIENFSFFCYNKIRKERSISMNLKKLTAQISIFLQDGIMNPSKYKSNINNIFEGMFNKEIDNTMAAIENWGRAENI